MVKLTVFALLGIILSKSIEAHPVILVILDGFRHDYLSTYSTPNLDQILKQGVLAPRLQPEFPSFRETFLASLLSGQHTENILQSVEFINDPNYWNATRTLFVST